MTPDEAKATLEADKQRRIQAALAAVREALAAYNCDLLAVTTPSIAPDGTVRVQTQIQVMAR